MNRHFVTAACALEAFAFAIWLGGLSILGAVVAPTIFGAVPRAADAMTLVFQRFDRIAMTAAVIVLCCEAFLAMRGGPIGRPGLLRAAAAIVASALAIIEGVWLTPSIVALHLGGAMRGVGEAGVVLDRTHHLAEAAGKAQVTFGMLAFVLVVVKAATPAHKLHRAGSHSETIGESPDVAG